MKCPKCGFFGPDYLDVCKKCGKNLLAEKEKLGLTFFRVRDFRSRRVQKTEPPGTEDMLEKPLDSHLPKPGLLDEIGPKAEAIRPQMVSPSGELKEKVQKDSGIPPKPGTAQPDQQEKPPMETMEENFQFEPEEEQGFNSAPIEKTLEAENVGENISHSQEALDDFEFPDFKKTGPPTDLDSIENSDFSTLSMLEEESESFNPLAEKGEGEGLSDEKTLVDSESPLQEDGITLNVERMPRQESGQKEGTGTELLNPQEVEDILQSETASSDESPAGTIRDRSKTQLLDEDELARILDDLDTNSSSPDSNPKSSH